MSSLDYLKTARETINKIEKKRFDRLAEQLKKSVKHILATHKELISYR